MSIMNHAAYQKKLKTLTTEVLRYIISDCQEALAAMPDNPKSGYYADEINYCAMELKSRKG